MSRKSNLPPIPSAVADVALIDGPTCAASSGMALSTWHDLVRLRKAPQPVIRRPRCTRWRMSDLRAFLIERADQGIADAEAAQAVTAKASKAAQHRHKAACRAAEGAHERP